MRFADLFSFEENLSDSSALPQSDFGMAFVKMLVTLCALIALLAISFWFIKRLLRARGQRGLSPLSVHILERKALSPKTTLYLVEVEGKRVLLAESQLEVRRLESFVDSPSEKNRPLS